MNQIIQIEQKVHKDQLRAIIEKCGFKTTPDTFRNLDNPQNGHYRNLILTINDGKATVLSSKEAEKYQFHPERKQLENVLGPKVITDATIIESANGKGYLTCKLNGLEPAAVIIGASLMHLYKRGHTTPEAIAASYYRNEMVSYYHSVTIQADWGNRWTNGTNVIYHGENMGEGKIYKDMTAFEEQEGICFIDKENLEQYEMDLANGKLKDISEYGITYRELVSYARTLALRNPEQVARYALQNSTWQSPFTELEDIHNNCDAEDILELDEEIQDLYDLYVENNGVQPNYAEVYITYKDGEGIRSMIALNEAAGEAADEEVVFTCSSFDEFKKLAVPDNGEDFVVEEIYSYSMGDMGVLQKVDMDETADNMLGQQLPACSERVIQVDMAVTEGQLRDILSREGIVLPEILPGIDEPLPLDDDTNYVAADYLRIVDNTVLDWTDEYQYRDAKLDDSNLKIESLVEMTRLQALAATSSRTMDETPWFEDLSRITDVRVYRNPMNKSAIEFRMRCCIDGVQQLGRVITTQDVEDLANGADKKKMASQVFAREMTLNNPQNEQKTMKR